VTPNSGFYLEHTPVTLTGLNFGLSGTDGPPVTVAIGTHACDNVSVVSNTEISCIVPPLEGSFVITVTVDRVHSTESSVTFAGYSDAGTFSFVPSFANATLPSANVVPLGVSAGTPVYATDEVYGAESIFPVRITRTARNGTNPSPATLRVFVGPRDGTQGAKMPSHFIGGAFNVSFGEGELEATLPLRITAGLRSGMRFGEDDDKFADFRVLGYSADHGREEYVSSVNGQPDAVIRIRAVCTTTTDKCKSTFTSTGVVHTRLPDKSHRCSWIETTSGVSVTGHWGNCAPEN
jgi:hypothetical protein